MESTRKSCSECDRFVIRRADSRELNAGGYKYADPRFDAKKYAASRYGVDSLPKKVDLRKYMSHVEDQEEMNSCTANAVAGAYEYLVRKNQQIDYDVSRLFIYDNAYNVRKAMGEEGRDDGSMFSEAVASLEQIGASAESSWPYEKRLVTRRPYKPCYADARDYIIDDTWDVLNEALGDYDIPHRLGALFAVACSMDDKFSDEELKSATRYLQKTLQNFNIDMNAKCALKNCIKLAQNKDFVEESVEILERYLSTGALARIAADMYEIVGSDGLEEEEETFIDALVGRV